MLQYVTFESILKTFDPSVYSRIKDVVYQTRATHVVLAENMQADSSKFGQHTLLCVGPLCTYKTPTECEGSWLHDTPSERQYFIRYAAVPQEWRL